MQCGGNHGFLISLLGLAALAASLPGDSCFIFIFISSPPLTLNLPKSVYPLAYRLRFALDSCLFAVVAAYR